MPLLPRIALVLSMVAMVFPGFAEAQIIPVSITQLEGGGVTRTSSEDILDGMNLDDCADASATITLDFGSNPGALDVWHDDGGSNDCSTADNRAANSADRNCIHLAVKPTIGADGLYTLNLSDVLEGDLDNDRGQDICTRNRTDIGIYFLVSEASIATDEVTSYALVTVPIDGQAPAAPVLDESTLTGNRVTVSWEDVSDSQDGISQLRYIVQVNTDGCGMFGTTDAGIDDAGTDDAGTDDAGTDDAGTDDAGTDAGTDDAGTDAGLSDAGVSDAAMDGAMSFAIISEEETDLGENSTTVDLGSLGVAEGGQAGVRVATKDQAGNVGAFSAEACVTRMTGIGPCELLEGGCEDSGGCSAAGGGSAGTLGLLALLFFGRKRR